MSIDDSGRKAVIHASVPEAMAAGLKAIAEAEDRSVSAQLGIAVGEHIAQHEQEARTTHEHPREHARQASSAGSDGRAATTDADARRSPAGAERGHGQSASRQRPGEAMSGYLHGIFPSPGETEELQRAGWSLVSASGPMLCIKKDESGLMLEWPEALVKVRSERAAASKNGRR